MLTVIVASTLVAIVPTPPIPTQATGFDEGCFIENRGQWDAQGRYRASFPGFDLWVLDDGLLFAYRRTEEVARTRLGPEPESPPSPPVLRTEWDLVTLRFDGGSPLRPVAAEPLEGTLGYFVGPKERHAPMVRRFAELRLQSVYPGVDVLLRTEGGRLRYDFDLSAGADPSSIRLRFEGASEVAVDSGARLRIGTRFGDSIHGRSPPTSQPRGALETSRSVPLFVPTARSASTFSGADPAV
ncbi:MAG: hypothetical protein KIS66_17240 [Fimbriimonadaceae bacterium]|nr:hypothetical protein [Fimbriimonadaceae bacterium]